MRVGTMANWGKYRVIEIMSISPYNRGITILKKGTHSKDLALKHFNKHKKRFKRNPDLFTHKLMVVGPGIKSGEFEYDGRK